MATVGNVIDDRVRYMLQDTDASAEIWSDTILIPFIGDGVMLLAHRLPEIMLTAPNTVSNFTFGSLSALSSVLPINDDYVEALAYYVCWRALAMDGQDKRDLKRSKDMAVAFTALTGIPLTL